MQQGETPAPQVPAAASPTASPPTESQPWRLEAALGGPAWFHVQGEQRTRYETLDNQFRFRSPNQVPPVRGFGDSEDVLALRTWIRLTAQGDRLGGSFEILDSRQYGTTDSSPVDTTMVNTIDVLQAYVDLQLGELGGGRHRLRIGRETVDLGNRRLIARNAFRNTINSFNAIDWAWTGADQSLRVFWSTPTIRLPDDFESLQGNKWELDRQSLDTQFAGIYYDMRQDDRTNLEFYLFGLGERGAATRQRELLTPGLRWNRRPKAGSPHYEIELTGQFGESKASTATSGAGARKLDHLAGFAQLAMGYTFDSPWSPSVTLSYAYATGDQDPDDGRNERYDTLFGARRFEYGPTGIWGAIARANLNSPELRLQLQPSKRVEAMVALRGVWLASERDAWTAAGLRDRSGASGSHVGQQLEGRIRWDILKHSFSIEIGGAVLFAGSFQDQASGGQGRDASYGYVVTTWTF